MKIASKYVLLCYEKQRQWRKVRWFVTLGLLTTSLWITNSTKLWRWTIKVISIMRITITWKLTAWNTKRHWNWLSRYLLSFAKWKFQNGCSSIVYIYDNYDFICHNYDSILPYCSLCPIFGMITTFHTFVFTVHLYNNIQLISPQCRIYASVNRVSIGLDDGLLPIRPQAIIWTKAGILLIEPLGQTSGKF